MKDLFYSSLSENIGITLLHSLWQGLLGLILIILISLIVKTKYSTIRYWLFTGVMFTVFITNAITFSSSLANPGSITNNNGLNSKTSYLFSEFSLNSAVPAIALGTNSITGFLPYFVMCWWIGILLLFVRFAINFRQTMYLSRRDHHPVATEIILAFEHLKKKLEISKIVKLVESGHILVPSVIGHLKPVILLPIGLVNGLSTEQVEAILIHELSHIKRHDFLVNIFQSVVEVLYFFNPFIWIISRAIRDEREHASDDTAISMGVSASVYAKTLAGVFNYAFKRQQFTLAFASRNKLTLKRIQRIMKTRTNNNKLVVSMIFAMAITFSIYFGAQSRDQGAENLDLQLNGNVMAISQVESAVPTAIPKVPIIAKIRTPKPAKAVFSDTTDLGELEKNAEALEKAMEELKATKEWQEVQELSKGMATMQLHNLKELSPVVEEALRLAEKSIVPIEVNLLAIEEEMEMLADLMVDIDLDKEIEEVVEISREVIAEASLPQEIELYEIKELAEVHAREAENLAKEALVLAREAEQMAEEAEKHAETVVVFLDELKPMLIKDGYLKSSDKLEQLEIKEGNVWVNGDKVKTRDARNYTKLHEKYFGEGDGLIFQN